ncbi:MAG TPA: hypothetical protein VHL31_24115 [Geminicoccus sp.]|jgi:hypothetical protein|uniref:hypothetical protein n=1 Tax=Geminicoccus sp. TaxID=2024832 RepID=UPI002E33C828|nr:hypothetical protein [Geminicoccus sp.]HEX2529365.1 hypothetical protein [Geminicoccus sp.]
MSSNAMPTDPQDLNSTNTDPLLQGGSQSGLPEPPFSIDDVSARRTWLWRLAFHTFEARAKAADKLDTRFLVHLSELLDLSAASRKQRGSGQDMGLGEFLHGLSVDEFAQYKRQCEPI